MQGKGYRAAVKPTGDTIHVLDLVISDVVMPRMNGRELADAIRRVRPDIRVLFMSGYTEDVVAPHGVLEEGMNFVQKPFSMEFLLARVREVLG